MTDITFSAIATVPANTKRGNITTGFVAHLIGLQCTEKFPVDTETRLRLQLNTPHTLWQTMFQGELDIKKGDKLVIDTVEYPISHVEPWPYYENDMRLRVYFEDLRN